MDTTRRLLGERIFQVRKKLKLTQTEFGRLLGGIKKSPISTYETGDAFPRADTIAQIARLGGVSLDWLLTGKEADQASPDTGWSRKKGEIAATIEPGRPRSGKSEGGVVGTPVRGEAANKEINVHEGVMMTTKVLSSNTGYANALWHNLKSFDAAVDREAEVGEMKEMMAEMMKKIDRLEEAVATPVGETKKRDEAANS